MMPRSFKEKVKSLNVSLNRWEDKVVCNKMSLMKLEDNLKAKEEKARPLKPLY